MSERNVNIFVLVSASVLVLLVMTQWVVNRFILVEEAATGAEVAGEDERVAEAESGPVRDAIDRASRDAPRAAEVEEDLGTENGGAENRGAENGAAENGGAENHGAENRGAESGVAENRGAGSENVQNAAPPPDPAERPLRAEDIDPLLGNANLLVRRTNADETPPRLAELESLFSSEARNPSWAAATEPLIVGEVSRVPNLAVTHFDVECRETVCRLKFFYPVGTDTLARRFDALADALDFVHSVEVISLSDSGVPISVLYLQRSDE